MADPTRFMERFFKTLEGGRLDQIVSLAAPDIVYVDMSDPRPVTGRAAYREVLAGIFAGLPDFKAHKWTLVVQGDRVAAELELGGTHLGPFLGYPASGAEIRWPASSFYTLNHGRDQVVREVWYHDMGALNRQLAAQSPLIQPVRSK